MPVPDPTVVTTVVGFAVWAAGLLLLPAPLAARIMLLGPLVVVPRLLANLPRRGWSSGFAGAPALVGAVVLAVSFAVPAGPLAALLTVPWLALAAAVAAAAVMDGLRALPAILHPRRAADLGVDASLAFLAIGAIFVTLDRLGAQLLGFSPAIILLTATHFHFAGFGLLGVASIDAAARRSLRGAVLGLIVGMPVTALGFTLPSSFLGAVGALIVGGSGIVFALGLIRSGGAGAARSPRRIAGAALLIGMPLGIAWSIAILLGVRFLDLESMVRSHGALNATAVLLVTLALPHLATDREGRTETTTTITMTTEIAAPIERVFDLARDLDLHAASMAASRERAIRGRTAGRIELGETVTWRARHFGVWWTLTSRITEMVRPVAFADEQVSGPFERFHHQHRFETTDRGTRMTDVWVHRAPFGVVGVLADRLFLEAHMRNLLGVRNAALKAAAEAPTG